MNITISLIVAVLTFAFATSAFAADTKTKPADSAQSGMPPGMTPEMMKKMMDAMKPGAAHKVLSEMAGNWTYTSKMWSSADGKPEESKGTSEMKMIFGGRYLQHEIKGKAMGQDWEGMGYTGFDNVKQKYQTVWMDGMSTGVMHGEATFDATSKTLKDNGSYSCPVTGKDRTYRSEWKIVDKNNMVFAMYGVAMDGTGPEFKNMEMTFKRRK